jgi:putative two-component system response regulator
MLTRIPVEVEIAQAWEVSTPRLAGELWDVSRGGAKIRLARCLPPHTRLRLTLPATAGPLQMTAEVVWTSASPGSDTSNPFYGLRWADFVSQGSLDDLLAGGGAIESVPRAVRAPAVASPGLRPGLVPDSAEAQGGHVLIVDDSPLVRGFLADHLAAHGYHISTAGDGEEAIATVGADPPDVILLDAVMPKLDGFEVCRLLKAEPRTILIPIVMITVLRATEHRLRAIEAGADEFLTKPVNPEELLTRVRSLLKLKRHTDELENAETVFFSLALSIEAKDPYTNGHCDRLARYGVALGRRLGLSADDLKALHRGGILHDVGKIGVPDAILFKPGPLTDIERTAIQTHPILGERICAPLKSLRLVLPIIRHHHERWDGSGYPDGLAGEAIPLTARLLEVVDSYDAVTTQRPYKPAYPAEAAFGIMREETEKGWLDGNLVESFIALMTESGLATAGEGTRTAG